MADPHSTTSAGRFEVRVTADTHFGWIRTRLSVTNDDVVDTDGSRADRLRLRNRPVLRTLRTDAPGARPAAYPNAPRDLGLALISCGVLALLISVWQYLWGIRYLWSETFVPIAGLTREGMHTPVIAIAVLLIGIGVFAFFAVLLRLV